VSRNRDIVAMKSLSKTGRLSNVLVSIDTASTLFAAAAPTVVAASLTVISCVIAAIPSTSFCGAGARAVTRTRVDDGAKPSNRARIWYWPAGTCSKRNVPTPSVEPDWTTAPVAFKRSTSAPSNTAPVWSCTTPVTATSEPVCAAAGATAATSSPMSVKNARIRA
jgi:hypothetical protein